MNGHDIVTKARKLIVRGCEWMNQDKGREGKREREKENEWT